MIVGLRSQSGDATALDPLTQTLPADCQNAHRPRFEALPMFHGNGKQILTPGPEGSIKDEDLEPPWRDAHKARPAQSWPQCWPQIDGNICRKPPKTWSTRR
jgi:hypothetical protein